jgi:hypothetical protein
MRKRTCVRIPAMSRVKEFTYFESYPKQVAVANKHLDAMSERMTIESKDDLLENANWSHEDMFLLDEAGNFVDFALPCYLVAEE